MKHTLRLVALATCPILAPDAVRAQEPATAFAVPLADELPGLAELSVWGLDADPDTPAAERGAFAIGNGRVFAIAGLGSPASVLAALTGPRYGLAPEREGGAFGRAGFELVGADGEAIPLAAQRVRRVRRAGFVVTEDTSEQVAVRATWFALPGGEARILAAVDVVACGDTALEGLALRAVAAEREVAGASARISLVGPDGEAGERLELGRLEPGGRWRGTAQIATFERDGPPSPPDRAMVLELARSAQESWQQRHAEGTRYDSDHLRLRDLVDDWRVTFASLQCAHSGAVLPMAGRRIVHVRDQRGPLLAFLRYRMWDEARRILDLQWRATLAQAAVPASIDVSALPAAESLAAPDAEFWQRVSVPPGDVAAWIVLQHHWYWRATRDLALIEERWPLLEVCYKRAERREDVLMPFAGDEPWIAGIRELPADVLGEDPELLDAVPAVGPTARSFPSAVLYLLAVHAVAELVDARDRARNPARWRDGTPQPAPGTPFVERAFELMAGIEARFWQADLGLFAPALSPVDGSPLRAPIANANLLPLWAGWIAPSGEKSRDNLRNSLQHLWVGDGRVGTTRTLGAATGDLQGMLLVALSERDGVARLDVLDALLASASPAGEWSSFHDADGRPITSVGCRLDPAVAGVNVDAILFATLGIRHATLANWDDEDIRLELRLPRGASWFRARGLAKDGRVLDLYFQSETRPLDEAERIANDELPEDRRRDPSVPHRRVRFVVELVAGEPQKGYFDVAINAEGTMFPRYLQPDAPTEPGAHDFRRIDEMEFATDDRLEFLPARRGPGLPIAPVGEQR